MITLADIIKPDPTHTQEAAVLLGRALDEPGYVRSYTPTRSAIKILGHLTKAVLPGASSDMRAINLHGPYGSGKSHLGAVIGRLLRDGISGSEFPELLAKLNNLGETDLADKLKNTFLDPEDEDFKPYLLVSLYATSHASSNQSLAQQLIEALYQAIQKEPKLANTNILIKTEYDAAHERLRQILERAPQYATADLSQWNQHTIYAMKDLENGLKNRDPNAYKVFLAWYKATLLGDDFNPANYGGQKFIDAYAEAGKCLKAEGYAGIAILWDEFGNALAELIRDTSRNAISEVIQLQQFIEQNCAPDLGHTLFISLTHHSLAQYGARGNATAETKDSFEKIEGRYHQELVELKPSETEGYHLLGTQLSWTDTGREYLNRSQTTLQKLRHVCSRLPLFKHLHQELESIIPHCYPLHPVTAAALFAISTQYAQATRTAFTFFRDLQATNVFSHPIDPMQGLFGAELIRLPVLIQQYKEELERKAESDINVYQRALAEIHAKGEEVPERDAILAILLLSKLLGENFQATDDLLAVAIYDSAADSAHPEALWNHLNSLKNTGLIWKSEHTGVWSLAGESGVDAETLVVKKLEGDDVKKESVEFLLNNYPDMREDLLPHYGDHDLEPSNCGIVRSYSVEFFTPPNPVAIPSGITKFSETSSYAASLYLVLPKDELTAQEVKTAILALEPKQVYFWLPQSGIAQTGLPEKLRRYLAIQLLMQEDSSGEGLKRQLQAKWEKNRQDLIEIFAELYGRKGLEQHKAIILKAGDPNPLNCQSWHQFRLDLAKEIQKIYNHEIHVRNMNLNKIRDEDYIGQKKLTDIIQKILDFVDGSDNDLLGESETSEKAAIIDGIFGANNLFIERAGGWSVKSINETEGAMREVLDVIHKAFTDPKRRTQPLKLISLRNTLISVPYGLPPVAHALFAAVALRQDQKRIILTAKNRSKMSFAENLSKAFDKESDYEAKLEDFSPDQQLMLTLLGLALPDNRRTSDYKQAANHLQAFLKELPDAIKKSPNLPESARRLAEFAGQIGRTAHDIAESLLKLTPAPQEFSKFKHSYECVQNKQFLEEAIQSFLVARDGKYHDMKAAIEKILTSGDFDRIILLDNLQSHDSAFERTLYRVIQAPTIERHELDALAHIAVDHTIDESDDKTLGQIIERIRATIVNNKESKDDEKREVIRSAIKEALTQVANLDVLISNLEAEQTPKLIALAKVLRNDTFQLNDHFDAFILDIYGKALRLCNSYQVIGIASQIKQLVDQHHKQKPKPEELHRYQLNEFFAQLRSKFNCDSILKELKNSQDNHQGLNALDLAVNDGTDDHLDALVLEWLNQSIAHCTKDAITRLEYDIEKLFNKNKNILNNREALSYNLHNSLSKVLDKNLLIQNLRREGGCVATHLADMAESGELGNPAQLDELVRERLKKPIEFCNPDEINSLSSALEKWLQSHTESHDPHRKMIEEFKGVIRKHKSSVEQTALVSALEKILEEIREGQL